MWLDFLFPPPPPPPPLWKRLANVVGSPQAAVFFFATATLVEWLNEQGHIDSLFKRLRRRRRRVLKRPSMKKAVEETSNLDCVVCLQKPQTSGFLHCGESHKCVCKDCAKLLERTPDLKCPICMRRVEKVIYRYF